MDKYLIALSQINGLGPKKLRRLEKYFPSFESAWQATATELIQVGLDERTAISVIEQKNNIQPDFILEQLAKKNINVLTIYDNDYPKLLKEIYTPPVVLYFRGDSTILNNQFILAVVGTRKITAYGKMALENLIPPLINFNFIIVSGLALGTDSCAHELTVKNNGQTIAVLGSGIDQIYPRANLKLADEILEKGGLIISEFPLGTLPLKQNFPYRNRVISGLSSATLITEADLKSGAMITAKYALEQNREVLALPGNFLQKQSEGTNKLIQAGAKIVTDLTDILEIYNLTENKHSEHNKSNQPNIAFNSTEEELIYNLIKDGAGTLDLLRIKSRLPTAVLNANLTILEIKGAVKNINGEFYPHTNY